MIARPAFHPIAFVFIALACAAGAQTYQVSPNGAATPQQSPAQSSKQSSNQQLGFGSGLENARLARAAEQALAHGDHAQALEFAQRAAKAAPNDPQIWFLLGYAARLNGKYQQSIDAYNRGLRLNPGSLDGQSGLAQDLSLTGRTADAQKMLEKIVAAGPRRRDDILLLGDISMRSKDYTGALEWLNKAERLQPDARSELLLALSYQQLKQMDQASRYLNMAKHRAPNNPDVQRSLAGYYREVGKYSDAVAALKSIRSPKPDVVAELAYTYQLDGKLTEASTYYAQAANARPRDLPLQISAAQAQVVSGSIAQADPFLARAQGLDANDYRLHAIRGEIAQIEDRDDEAVDQYRAAVANLPPTPSEGPLYGIQLHMDMVALYKNLGDDASAQRELATAQSGINAVDGSGPNRGPFLRLRALIRMNGGDLDGALSDVKEALATDSQNRDDLQLDGDVLMKLGHTEEAIVAYKHVLSIDPVNRFALTSLGYASRAAGRDQDAEKYFERLAQVDPSLYIPYLALGDLYTSRREYTKAQVSYAKGYKIAPKNALIVAGGMNAAIEAHNLPLAGEWMVRVDAGMEHQPQVLREKERYLSFQGKYQESADAAREAIKTMPHDRDVVVYLGYDLLHLQDDAGLLALTSQYLNVLPKEPDIPLLAGYVHKQQGQNDLALADFSETIKRDPTVVTAYVNRGYVENDLHQPKAAAADFEIALRREPANGEAHLGLAYADLDLHRPRAAVRQSELAQKVMGDSKDIHLIRATAYGSQDMLGKAADEYRAALKYAPDDPALYLGLGNALLGQRKFHEAADDLATAAKLAPQNADIDALLARAYANLADRDQTLHYIQLAEQNAQADPPLEQSQILVSTGEALSALGDQNAAMDRFRRALEVAGTDRVGVRLAVAQLMAQQGHPADAERQIALAWMEAAAGDATPPTGTQFIAAADVFRSTHEYGLSQNYLERAKRAGAPDAEVRIGMADNYLAQGDTTRAQGELAAVNASAADTAPSYQYLLAEANVYRQEHHSAEALTSFAQASDAGGEDETAEQSMLSAAADEGLRVTPVLSVLSDLTVGPIFEDSTVYVLDSKLDSSFPVPPTSTSLLPTPRSSIQTQWTDAFHLHVPHVPTASGFFQLRNARGVISVPATASIVNRDTTDYTLNFGLNPTVHIGDSSLTFDGGIQGTLRRDAVSPAQMNQNLLREFGYVSSSSFFNVISFSGYLIYENGPFTEANLRSRTTTGAIDFRVGSPWGRTALVTGWGATDQLFKPTGFQNYYTSAYVGVEHHFSTRFNLRAVAEDVRAWRIASSGSGIPGNLSSGIAQNLRPAASFDFAFRRNWNAQVASSYSSTRGFHVYDAVQNGFSVSYARPIHRRYNDSSGPLDLAYPIRFSAGMQEETFFNFSGAQNQQLRPYFEISIF